MSRSDADGFAILFVIAVVLLYKVVYFAAVEDFPFWIQDPVPCFFGCWFTAIIWKECGCTEWVRSVSLKEVGEMVWVGTVILALYCSAIVFAIIVPISVLSWLTETMLEWYYS